MTAGVLSGDRRRLLGAIGLGALALGCGVALLGTSAWLLSRAAEHPPVMYLMVAIVSVRAFGLGKAVFRYAERLVGHDLALRRQAGLRIETYRALTRSTWVGRRGGDLLSRVVNDVEAVQDLVVRAIVPIASVGIVAVSTTAVLIVLSPAAGALILVSAVLSGVVVPLAGGQLAASATAAQAPLRGELAAVAGEAAEAAPDLIAYAAGGRVAERLSSVDTRLRRVEARAAWSSGLAGAAQVLAAALAVVGALIVGAGQVAAGTLPPVQLAVLVLTPLALHEVLGTVPAAVLAWRRARAALARVSDLLEAPPVGTPDRAEDCAAGSRPVDDPHVVLRGLAAGWPGAEPVVRDLELSIGAGERVALIGPTGVGKTTVAATILGLLPPVAGSVEVTGTIGCLAQDAYLFDTSVAENVRIGRRDADDGEIAAALRTARLDLPLDRMVGLHGSGVSGGEARRIALARLLVRRDDVLILDEPTEHLDGPTATALLADVWRLTAGAAVLVITHDPAVVAGCDRVVALDPVTSRSEGRPRSPTTMREVARARAE